MDQQHKQTEHSEEHTYSSNFPKHRPLWITIIRFIEKFIEVIIRSAYFLISIVFILGAFYILGGASFLHGKWGTDFVNAIGTLLWINKYFPSVPFWNPIAAGGISLTHAYPMLGFYLAAFLRSISSLTIIQAFVLIGFISVAVMALSIYFFASFRFKNQTAGLIASVLYLISPIAWTWLVDWGFYAEAVSHMFAGPSILFWDLFFTRAIKRDWGVKTRLCFFFLIVFFTLAMGVHFIEGIALIRFFSFYLIGYTILSKGERKAVFLRGAVALLLTVIIGYLTTLIITVPYSNFMRNVDMAGLTGNSYESMKQSAPNPLAILGFHTFKQTDFLLACQG